MLCDLRSTPHSVRVSFSFPVFTRDTHFGNNTVSLAQVICSMLYLFADNKTNQYRLHRSLIYLERLSGRHRNALIVQPGTATLSA